MDIEKALDFLWRAAHEPAALLLVMAISLLIVVSHFLNRSINRYRAEIQVRIEECEDAHLLRDKIQIEAIQLIAELLTTLRGIGRAQVETCLFGRRSDDLIKQIRSLNDEILKRREDTRRSRQ